MTKRNLKDGNMLKKFKNSKYRILWIAALLVVKIAIGLAITSFSFLRFPVFAQNEPTFPEIDLVQVASGLTRPLAITHAGDGSGRIFVVEQPGRVMALDKEQNVSVFLDLQARVLSPASGGGNEQGLLGLAFPPGYAEEEHLYVYYTMRNGDNVVSRFSLTPDPDLADPDSEEQMLVLPHPGYTNHNGGQLAFGPDGYLYIGTGDGGGGGDPLGNAQNPLSLNGKLLRIDVEGLSVSAMTFPKAGYRQYCSVYAETYDEDKQSYLIPQDNPFVDDSRIRPEIWALGLRNPWRFSFDCETGDLFIADVGQNRWEEINLQFADSPGGENYGWNVMEGEECFQAGDCVKDEMTLPVLTYPIFSSSDCSITGGYVCRGETIPELDGVYIYGDFCSGTLWGLQKNGADWQNNVLLSTSLMISSFGEDEGGEIYVADISGGGIYRIVLP